MSEVDDEAMPLPKRQKTLNSLSTYCAPAAERMTKIHEACGYIQSRLPEQFRTPRVGMMCGTGLSYLGDSIEEAVEIPTMTLRKNMMRTRTTVGINPVLELTLLNRVAVVRDNRNISVEKAMLVKNFGWDVELKPSIKEELNATEDASPVYAWMVPMM